MGGTPEVAMAEFLVDPDFKCICRPDWGRTARLCAFNGAMGLFGHYYYAILDKTVVIGTAKSAITVLAKVGIDQFIFAPVCTMLFYLFKVSTEGRPSEFVGEMQAKYVPTLIAGWKLWPAAHVVNFLFIPNQHRILYTNIISVAGTYILSMAASGDHTAQKKDSKKKKTKKSERILEADGPNEVLFDGVTVKID